MWFHGASIYLAQDWHSFPSGILVTWAKCFMESKLTAPQNPLSSHQSASKVVFRFITLFLRMKYYSFFRAFKWVHNTSSLLIFKPSDSIATDSAWIFLKSQVSCPLLVRPLCLDSFHVMLIWMVNPFDSSAKKIYCILRNKAAPDYQGTNPSHLSILRCHVHWRYSPHKQQLLVSSVHVLGSVIVTAMIRELSVDNDD